MTLEDARKKCIEANKQLTRLVEEKFPPGTLVSIKQMRLKRFKAIVLDYDEDIEPGTLYVKNIKTGKIRHVDSSDAQESP